MPDASESPPVPVDGPLGISLAGLRTLADEERGESATSTLFVAARKRCADDSLSFCARQRPSPAVGRATVFVICSGDESLASLVDALALWESRASSSSERSEERGAEPSPPSYYIDALSEASPSPISCFFACGDVLSAVKKAVVVLPESTWSETPPTSGPLRDLVALHALACASDLRVPVEIVMPRAAEHALLRALARDSARGILRGLVSTNAATAGLPGRCVEGGGGGGGGDEAPEAPEAALRDALKASLGLANVTKRAISVVRAGLNDASIAAVDGLQPSDDSAAAATMAVGTFLLDAGQPAKAEALARRAAEAHAAAHGPTHASTLSLKTMRVLALRSLGRIDEAEAEQRVVLAALRAALGDRHESTLAAMSTLASLLRRKEEYAESERLFREVLWGCARELGDMHPLTLRAVNDYGLCLEEMERYREARLFFAESVKRNDKLFGRDHPSTLSAMNNLAVHLKRRGAHAEALALYREIRATRTTLLGEKHPETLAVANDIALLHVSRKDFASAAPLFLDVFRGRSEVLGPRHADTLASAFEAAQAFLRLGRWDDAAPLLEASVEGHKAAAGLKSMDLLVSLRMLGHTLLKIGMTASLARAAVVFGEAVACSALLFGETDSMTEECRVDLARVPAPKATGDG